MRNLDATFRFLVALCSLGIAGCGRVGHSDSSGARGTNSLADLKGESPVRYLCSYCGAWREADPVKLFVSLSEGAKPGSADEKAIADAKESEGPFMVPPGKVRTLGRYRGWSLSR